MFPQVESFIFNMYTVAGCQDIISYMNASLSNVSKNLAYHLSD